MKVRGLMSPRAVTLETGDSSPKGGHAQPDGRYGVMSPPKTTTAQDQQGPTYWTKVHLGTGIQPARVKATK